MAGTTVAMTAEVAAEATAASATHANANADTPDTTMAPPYRVCLIGSGGVGTIASLVLSKSKLAHVTVVLRSKYEHVSQHGWQVDSIDHGRLEGWRPKRVVRSVEEAAWEAGAEAEAVAVEYDYVVVCTKQQPERSPVPAMIGPVVTAGRTTVVLIQNGLGIEDEVIAEWPGNVVMSSVSHIGSAVAAPNLVTQTGRDVSKMGPHYHEDVADAVSLARARAFVDMYVAGGASECLLVAGDAMPAARWEKLLWNGTFNPVCALTRADVGQVQRSGARETLLVPMMWEVWHTAKAAGHALPESVVPWMAYRLPDDCAYRASMLLDLEAGRPMELEVILGNPLRVARRLGVATPVMETVYRLLQVEQWKVLQADEKQ